MLEDVFDVRINWESLGLRACFAIRGGRGGGLMPEVNPAIRLAPTKSTPADDGSTIFASARGFSKDTFGEHV